MATETGMTGIGEKCIIVKICMIEETLENMAKRLVQQTWTFLQVIALQRQSTFIIGAVVRTATTSVGPMCR